MSGFAPYGYRKNPENKHQFLMDEEAARVVRRIFNLYLAGYSRGSIAGVLNSEKVLTPSEYKRKIQGLHYKNGREKPGAKSWTYSTLSVILKNRVYTGDMVQHKTEKISYKVDKYRYISEEEQIVVENTHEAIINKDTFERAQELMKKRTRTPGFLSGKVKVNVYAGMLVCGECGCNLFRTARREGYDCATYHKKGNKFCKSHFISEAFLNEVLKMEIRRHAALFIQCGMPDEVTREMAVELIDKIVVNGDKSIDIMFKYQSPYEKKPAAI